MKILAFDLGTSCGWATNVDGIGYSYGTLDLRPGRYSGGGMRYVNFQTQLGLLIDEPPGLVVFEEVRRHMGVDAAHVYGGLLACLTARCEWRKIPYQGVPVGTIKKHATGKGNASKKQMIEAARALVDEQDTRLTHDEADAVCLLDYALKTFGRAKIRPATPEELGREDAADLEQRTRQEEQK